jgi:hypothetical protein
MPFAILLGLAVALSVFFFWIGRRAARTTAGLDDQIGRYLEDNPTSILQNSVVARPRSQALANASWRRPRATC